MWSTDIPLIRITVKRDDRSREDSYECRRIIRVLKERGYDCTPEQAEQLWSMYSESFAAGWMSMRDMEDGDVFVAVRYYFEVDDDDESLLPADDD